MTIKKTDAEAYMKLARVSAASGDNIAALDFYKSASTAPNAPAHVKSYAQLCIARVLVKMNKLTEAAKIYGDLAKSASIPVGHRLEAFECAREVARLRAKLPARNPSASRIKPTAIPKPGLRLYVSTKGSDSNPGSSKKPLATTCRRRLPSAPRVNTYWTTDSARSSRGSTRAPQGRTMPSRSPLTVRGLSPKALHSS